MKCPPDCPAATGLPCDPGGADDCNTPTCTVRIGVCFPGVCTGGCCTGGCLWACTCNAANCPYLGPGTSCAGCVCP